ncbi:hypothetical protein M438DRAFT_348710 [Aureobasidium pullulans EXF-150]|uniref:Uncharacterized protein n=1 Tax=Aureobasidium pullulans EXF-150 TaxID=1043002 RepID=A0A074X9S8_AURPU|nr:uncharacterized protein M438DRAFT_348710 [Aureobasidium pullulans EXF-150]KEQ80484.1 hypothetical protein M438DRAFT_348710 [Aureobasidium pullulans EXF-150]
MFLSFEGLEQKERRNHFWDAGEVTQLDRNFPICIFLIDHLNGPLKSPTMHFSISPTPPSSFSITCIHHHHHYHPKPYTPATSNSPSTQVSFHQPSNDTFNHATLSYPR